MTQDNKKQAVIALADEPVKKEGYTIDQLKYQIALTSLKRDFCKEKLVNTVHSSLNNAPWSKKSGGGGMSGFASPLIGTVLRGLSYTDYILLGFSVFKTAKNIFSFVKRKKK